MITPTKQELWDAFIGDDEPGKPSAQRTAFNEGVLWMQSWLAAREWFDVVADIEQNLRSLGIEMTITRTDGWRINIYDGKIVKLDRQSRQLMRWAGTHRLDVYVPPDKPRQ